MQMAPPALGLMVTTGEPPNFKGDFIEHPEVGVCPLGFVKPVPLGGMGCESCALGRKDGAGINEGFYR